MNAIIFSSCFKYWRRCGLGVLAAIFMLDSTDAFAQSTVTTFANTYNRAGAGKASSKGVLTTAVKFNFPAGIALDPSGSLMFVADYNNNAIRLVYNLGNQSSSVTYTVYTNKNGINHPIGVAVDAATNVFVLNYGTKGKNGSLMIFNGSYLINYQLYAPIATPVTNLTNAAALALDNLDNAYITVQGNTVIRVTPLGATTTVGVITNAKTSLTGIAYIGNGKVAISDAGNNGIWVMDTTNTNLFGNATKLTGFHGANDILGPSFIAAFNHPQGIIAAGNGILVVADSYNNQVKQVDTNGTVTRLFGVNSYYWKNVSGLRTKGWNDGTVNSFMPLDTVQSRQPYALALGADGTVYDSEIYYDLLRVATGTGLPPLPPLPPPAPTILLVTTNIGQVTLTWSSVSGATNYNVKRSTDIGSITNGSFTTIASTTATTYTDTNVSGGVTYYYVVSALNAGGESANSAAVSATPPQPPVPDPQIGYVDFPSTANPIYSSVFHPVTSAGSTFNNDVPIVILGTDGSQTFYNYSNTPTATDVPNPTTSSATAPTPPPNGLGYHNGLYPSEIGAYTVAEFLPNLSIKAVGKQSGRPDSAVVAALFRFVVANPQISPNANNIYDFQITETTTGANLFYTLDGSDPRTNGVSLSSVASYNYNTTNSVGVWTVTGIPTITSNVLFQVYAMRAGYQDSAVVSRTFFVSNAVNNTIDFGFASGPGSCQFVASPGQTFVVPVGLSLLPDAPPIYGLQFNLTVTNLGVIPVTPGAVDFDSLLGKPDQFNDGYFLPIPTYAFLGASQPDNDSAAIFTNGAWYQSMQFTNFNNESLLGVGWLEIYGRTNLYNTKSQTLLTYPILRGNEPYPSKTQSVLGGYKFAIPTNAGPGDIYQIQIGRPSGITFKDVGYGTPVLINAPADTNLVGPGSLNALKNVTIGYKKYLVGDVYPANWFNAGDFGTMDLVTNGVTDVSRVFDFAVYPVAAPPAKSDLFDALDSCGNFGVLDTNSGYYTNPNTYPMPTNFVNAVTNISVNYNFDTNLNIYVENNRTTNIYDYSTAVYLTTYFVTVPYYLTNIFQPAPPAASFTTVVPNSYITNITPVVSALFDGNDTNINQIAFGDGQLDVCDIYVTFRRSLDSSLLWYERFWTNGQLVADTAIRNPAAHVVSKVASANLSAQPKVLNSGNSTVPPLVVFTASNISGTAGQVVPVPITATITGNYNLRLLMLNLSVVPTGNAPAIDTQVQFNQTATVLGSPHLTDSNGNGNYSAVWLNNASEGATGAGLTGTVTLGKLYVTIPYGAASGSTYTVSFDHASASPNGLASFPKLTVSGTITVQ